VRLIHRVRAWRPTLPPALAGRHPGQMMVLFALSFVAILAGVGMSVDMGMWMVEKQHLQTAVDSAAVAGARYFVAYAGDANQLSLAQTQAQTFLTQYGYPASAFSGSGSSLTMTSPGTRQFRIQAVRRRPTMLVQFVGIRTLYDTADTVANGEIKADIYVALDLTGSMSSTDITNMKSAVNTFVDLLGLDNTDPNGPKIGIGRFLGERCAHVNPGTYGNLSAQQDATNAANWVSFNNYTATTGSWCDNNNSMPTLAGATNPTSPPRSGTSSPTIWNNYFPGAVTPTAGQLGQVAATAHSAVNAIDTGLDTGCFDSGAPQWAAPPSMRPYGECDLLSGTSHTAGLATANVELSSARSRSAPFRKVLILQTDGTICTMQTAYTQLAPAASTIRTYLATANLPARTSSATRSENKAMALANYMKTTPTAFEGVEIFTIMFWADDGSNTCWDNSVKDTGTSLFPSCGPSTTTLPAVGTRSHVDDYMTVLSSSLPGTCDHYIPADKNNPTTLTNAYRDILKRLAVGKLVS
jgi:Flp pilus assembly protein TadG